MATKLQQCDIYPSSISHSNLSLPLTHFDVPFFTSNLTQRLIFFELSYSKLYFLETILPSLKQSLSSALSHFLPLAGNVIFPLNSTKPFIRYVPGDSVPMAIFQNTRQDFKYLTSNHQRAADEFYTLIPPLTLCNSIMFPAMAIQVTIFPEQGVCIGLTNSHVVGDESSFVNFVKIWGSINKFGSNNHLEMQPTFDRTIVQNHELYSKAWNLLQKSNIGSSYQTLNPTNKVRATFILTKEQIDKLKAYASLKWSKSLYVSSFTVACGYVWSCSETASKGGVDDDEPVYLPFPVDCRRHLRPPLPQSYFGNCVILAFAESRHGLLTEGTEGFLVAVKAMGETIMKTLYGQDGILERVEWPLDFTKYTNRRVMSVAGSPRFDVYDVDYGWGRAKKYEIPHIDNERSMSLSKSREFEGGLEIGLSMKKEEMEVFERVFEQGLIEMCLNEEANH